MGDSIVVGVDGSRESMAAVEWAADEAHRHGLPLRIVHVLPRYEYDIPFFVPGRWEAAKQEGEEFVAFFGRTALERHSGLEVTTHLPSGGAAAVLRAESDRADTVIVASHGRGGFGSWLLGSVSHQLAGHAACTVVVVRGSAERGYGRVVVGVDGSEHSLAAAGYAFREAALHGARLKVVHAWKLPPAHRRQVPVDEPSPADLAGVEDRFLGQSVQLWRTYYSEVGVDQQLVKGDPALALVAESEWADLLVVGSRGRGGFRGLPLGSVSHAVLHQAFCAVAVTRPSEQP